MGSFRVEASGVYDLTKVNSALNTVFPPIFYKKKIVICDKLIIIEASFRVTYLISKIGCL